MPFSLLGNTPDIYFVFSFLVYRLLSILTFWPFRHMSVDLMDCCLYEFLPYVRIPQQLHQWITAKALEIRSDIMHHCYGPC